ncbi:MAG: hypothetical protein PGN25_22155 [Methylorubrum populi]
MLDAARDLFLQDAFKVGLISSSENRSDIGCLIWDTTPDGADVQVGPGVAVPDTVRLSIACLKIDRRCAVVERDGSLLHLVFVR